MVTVYTLTPASAAEALRENGLDALGITALLLGSSWSDLDPAFDSAALTLTFAQVPKAPWRGILEYVDSATMFRAVDGMPMTGPAAVLRLHPQAAARLSRLAASRYTTASLPQVHAIPEVLVVRGIAADKAPEVYDPEMALPVDAIGKAITFHDARGLIVDPIAVAAILDDLLTRFPALLAPADSSMDTGVGSIRSIAGLASGIVAHVVTLHGRAFAPIPSGPEVQVLDNGGNPAGTPGANGLISLAAGDQLSGTGTGADARLRLGWATAGTLGKTSLQVPALPAGVSLSRRFIRVFAVDLQWHLAGNRSATEINGIAGDDQTMPADLHPQVHDGITIDYLADGPDTLGAISQVAARMTGAAAGGLMFAVSPTFEAAVGAPEAPGANAHWPAFPGTDTAIGFTPGQSTPSGLSASWSGSNNVVVAIPADFAPNGASIRIYPQRFQLIEAIGAEPSFVRGDGGAALAISGTGVEVLLQNPFNLAPNDPLPSPGILVFDLVITPRRGQRRIWAAERVSIAPGPAPAPNDPFASPDPLNIFPDNIRSISPVPLFGLRRTITPSNANPGSIADMARALMSETQPRQGPRLPTMMRHDTIVVTGISDGTTTAGLAWGAVLSGGRWARETRSAQHGKANPGNPAGPDTHAAGIRVNGALAYDLARTAVKRVQPILPLGNAATPGWLLFSAGNNFNPPENNPVNPAQNCAGIALQSIAAVVETPELSLLPDNNLLSSPPPISFQDVLTQISNAFGQQRPPDIDVMNADRLIHEIRREYFLSKYGSRDALWSLARAIGEADELVYIETAGLASTARPAAVPAAHEIDLIEKLAERMQANPNLKVLISVPRDTDFSPLFPPFVRRAITQRNDAIDLLRAVDASRVMAFHPRGFPGRWAQIRSTTVIVDDVWCLTGATHLRRRGMTFDGSVAIASLDHEIEEGYSRKIRTFRRELMAAKLGVTPTEANGQISPDWIRLQRPASAFDLIADLLQQGGLGKLAPLWLGPTDDSVIAQSDAVADPDGTDGGALETLLASFLSESPP
ncbi:hypothetical protein LG201_10225 [Methylobacillus gramineus]|uniref:hypothetical protein n=1 Tax=Methylobacillus gramineus TaxID=755169 RepID=UPI001CFFE8C1|nr:hypothetical protein [Methylobacillus gramineus]MCB5185578.1 hypothetical protein [Methylobacillus gramineus]